MFRNLLFILLLLIAGCKETIIEKSAANNTALNYKEVEIRQGAILHDGDLSIGVIWVKKDSAALSVFIGSNVTKIELKIGEEAQIDGYRIMNTGTSVDYFPGNAPGSDKSYVSLAINLINQYHEWA